MSGFDHLIVERRESACWITLNRPEAMNSLNPEIRWQLSAHLDEVERNDDIWLAVITGAGERAFSAGADLKHRAREREASAEQRAHWQKLTSETRHIIERWYFPKPLIAMVNGYALGGGLEVAMACDIIVAADDARFADTHGKWGMSPTWGMSQRLPRRVGLGRAKEMMYSGRVVDGAEAAQIGLAVASVPAAQLQAFVISMARGFLANSWFTLRADKMLVNGGLDHTLHDGLAFERSSSPGRGPDMEARLKAFNKSG